MKFYLLLKILCYSYQQYTTYYAKGGSNDGLSFIQKLITMTSKKIFHFSIYTKKQELFILLFLNYNSLFSMTSLMIATLRSIPKVDVLMLMS